MRHRLFFYTGLVWSCSALCGLGQVIITEFMASNGRSLADRDGDYSDWIELHNPGPDPVNLDGWSLTDNAANLTKWRFPATNLLGKGYLVVFASGKNRATAGGELHTDFSLDADGEYLGLVKPDGVTLASQFGPDFPPQNRDISYGYNFDSVLMTNLPVKSRGRVLVPRGSVSATWVAPAFDDRTWEEAETGIGYGANYTSQITTDLTSRMIDLNASALIRIPFQVANPSALSGLTLRMAYDDGFVAYFNGQEAARRNAAATTTWNSAATATHGPPLPSRLREDFDSVHHPYVPAQFSAPPGPVVTNSAGSAGRFLRLIQDGINAQANSVAFAQAAPGLYDRIQAQFDFRSSSTDSPADGFCFMLIPTSAYGTEGTGFNVAGIAAEEPNVPKVFAVGFDVYPHATQNDVSVHWDGVERTNVTLPLNQVDLASGAFHRARIDLAHTNGGALVTIMITPNILGQPGAVVPVVTDFFVAGLSPYDSRVQIAARSGGLNMTVDLDNVDVQFQPATGPLAFEEFALSQPLKLLRSGTNILAIHGLNRSASDPDFLILPEVVADDSFAQTLASRYFVVPTPGSANSAGKLGTAPEPLFSRTGGTFTNAFALELKAGSSAALLRYTTNGKEPTASSTLYAGPIQITSTTLIRAKNFEPGLTPSPTVGQTYTRVGADLVNFTSNLPLVIVNPLGRTIVAETKLPAYLTFINTNTARVSLFSEPDYVGRAGIEIRGSSSTGFPKKSYGLETRNEKDEDNPVGLLDLPRESDWVLYAPYTDKTMMRDVLAYELSNRIGRYAPRTRFVELFLASSTAALSMQNYQGVYVLIEKIKRDQNRVAIAHLRPNHTAEPEISGGYILKKDRLDANDSSFSTSRGQLLGIEEPKGDEIVPAQQTWIQSYMNQFEAALYGANYRDPTAGYAKFAEPDSFIDHHWLVELSKNIDGYRLSTFLFKDRGGKLNMGPIWDYNLTFGNADYLNGWLTNGWYYSLVGSGDYPWYPRLFQDADFKQRYIDRWFELRKSLITRGQLVDLIDSYAARLNEAQIRNYQKWRILGTRVWPNWYIGRTYEDELNFLKRWTTNRITWIDSQFVAPPKFNQDGGAIAPGFVLSITGSGGAIYYTLDGSDPRLPGGAVSTKAQTYSAPLALNQTTIVKARSLRNGIWSALAETVFDRIQTFTELLITEIMFNPPAQGLVDGDEFEFVELKNVGPDELDLSRVRFDQGIAFSFPIGAKLASGQSIVLVSNPAEFSRKYPGVRVDGVYSNRLSNAGERLSLVHAVGTPIFSVRYGDRPPWPAAADNAGFSLVPVNPNANADPDNPVNWRSSAQRGGSPGKDDPAVDIRPVWVNEILTHTDPPQVDAVELFNPNAVGVDIGNWYLTDDRAAPQKYRIPIGTVIPARGYWVLQESDFNPRPGIDPSFTFSSQGEQVYLYSADATGTLTGFSDGFAFGAAANGVSFGRHAISTGQIQYPAQAALSLGGANAGPRVGPVVIHEIHFHPLEGEAEFIELKNITASPVQLFDALFPTNTWKINGIGFVFPPNTVLGPHGLAVLANVEPGSFRAKFGIPSPVPLFQFGGALQDGGERLQLIRPDSPDAATNGAVVVPYIVIDEVRYNDRLPWPTNAEGGGASLQRLNAAAYGNDPINWRASPNPTPGFDQNSNQPPRVDAGVDLSYQSVVFPIAVTLTGAVVDDGLPSGPAGLSLLWSLVDGPGPVVFGNPKAAVTTAILPGVGSYRFKLRGQDGALTASDEVTVTLSRPAAEFVLAPAGSTWSYSDTGPVAGTAWREINFDDSDWKSGQAKLGYGNGDENTVIGYGPNSSSKYPTAYFRHAFNLTPTGSVQQLTVRLLRDDGAVLYLNGIEVFRSNMPEGDITSSTPAAGTVGGADENAFYEQVVNPVLLVPGKNVIAVQVHQVAVTSSDLQFDLELRAVGNPPNEPPQATAGADLTLAFPKPALLNGSAADDGLPIPPGLLTIAWSKVDGPGNVTFDPPFSPAPLVQVSEPGTYMLRLKVSDGVSTVQDDMTLVVTGDSLATWKAEYFTNAESADPTVGGDSADPDRDGLTNAQEYLCGTHPRDPLSRLELRVKSAPLHPGEALGVTFSAVAGRSYAIESKNALADSFWLPIRLIPAEPTDRLIQLILPTDGPSRFYRLVTPAP